MSNWKKIIVSGSQAHLSSVTASNGSIISGSLTMSGSIVNVNNLDFNMTSTVPSAAGRFVWDDGNGSLDLGLKGGNVNLLLGQQTYARIFNAEATTLNKGEVVYISGSQGNRVSAKRADYSGEGDSATTIGFVAESITSGGEGFIITNGVLENLNTVGLTQGKLLYLSSSGQYSETKPIAPQHTVTLGYVERVHATVGSIYVKIDNGYELDELHNVFTTGVSNGDLLMYSASLWKNSKQLSGSYGLTGSLQATSFTGSLQGSASYALQSLSASFATTASYVLGGGGGVSDGDKGDITVSSAGATWTIDNDAVTFAKMQNISPGVLGRQSAGSGDITTLTALTDYHVLQWLSGIPVWSSITTNNIQIFNNNRILGKGTGLASELSLGNGLAITGSTLILTGSLVTIGGPTSTDWEEYVGTPNRYMLISDGVTNDITASHILQLDTSNESINIYAGIEGYNDASIQLSSNASVSAGNFYANSGGGGAGNFYGTSSYATSAATASSVGTLRQNITVSGSMFFSGSLNTPVFVDYEEKYTTISPSAGNLTVNLSDGNIFLVNLNDNVSAMTISNPPKNVNVGNFTLIVNQIGVYSFTWPTAVTWSNGNTAPSLDGDAIDFFTFVSYNSGSNWYGFVGGQQYPKP